MGERDYFKEFIENLPGLDGFKGKDTDEKAIDEALVNWINQHYPRGFKIDRNRRKLIIAIFKMSKEIDSLLLKSPFRPYIDALLNMECKRAVKRELEGVKKTKQETDYYALLVRLTRTAFVLGYCLRCLEKKRKPPKKKKHLNKGKIV